MSNPDPYFKKNIPYIWNEHHYQFDVAHTIFSSFEVDKGTDLLLRTMNIAHMQPRSILDIGCGCGIIGIILAHQFPQSHVTMVDKDLLAIRYAQHNCVLNGVQNVHVYGSVGLAQVPDIPYDIIVSNIPAKIGDEAIEQEFIHVPLARLSAEGVYWFVVVSGLNHLIPRIGTQNNLRLKQMKKRSGHAVYRLQR